MFVPWGGTQTCIDLLQNYQGLVFDELLDGFSSLQSKKQAL